MGLLSFYSTSVLGWLFDSTIYISILICLILGIKAVARGKLPAWWSYGLWLLLVFRMLMPWGIESRASVFNYVPIPPGNESYMPLLMEKELPIPFLSHNPGVTFSTDIGLIDNVSNAGDDNNASQGVNLDLSLDKVLLGIWFVGVMLFAAITLYRNFSFWRKVRREPPVEDKAVIDALERFRSSLAIRKKVIVIATDKVKSPALFGYFKPRLLLPLHFLDTLETDELRYVFLHELSHLKRHDIGVSFLAVILQTIHWFNPLVWYALHQMKVDQEAACDAYVLLKSKQVRPVDYANTIVDLLERLVQNRQLTSMAGIIENKAQIRRRLTMIMNYKRYTLKTTLASFSMFLLVGLILFTSSSSNAVTEKQGITFEDKKIQFAGPVNEVVSGVDKQVSDLNEPVPGRNERRVSPLQAASSEKKLVVAENNTATLKKPRSVKGTETPEPVKKRKKPDVDYVSRGKSYLKNGQIEDAITDFNKAIRLSPENAAAYFARGNAYYVNGQVDQAISDYDKAIELNPRYTNAYFSRGYYYQATGEYDKAISDFSKVIGIHPENALAYNYRGNAYFVQEQHQKAVDDYNMAIGLDSEYADAYINRGSYYQAIGEYDNAVSDYDKVISIRPEDAYAYYCRGAAHFAREQYQKASEDYSKAIALNPGYADAYAGRGFIDHAIGKEYAKAISDYSKAIELRPDNAETYKFRGDAYLSLNRSDDALSDFNKAIALNPGYFDAYISRGNYYQYIKNHYNRAVDDYNEAIKLDPENAVARRLRRDAYVRIQILSMPDDIFSKPMIKVIPTHFEDKQITNAY